MRRIVDFVSGFATETTLALVRAAVDAINAKIPASPATTGKQDTGNTSLASLDGKTTVCNTGAVTVAACALPTGAATAAAQATGNASLSSIDGKVTACNTGAVVLATGAATIGKVDQGAGGASAWKVDGSAVTQPVSAASLPLPSGASTEAAQTTGNASLASILAKLIAAPSTEAKQDAGNASLVSILAKIIAAPATEAKQDTGNTSAATTATQTTTTATNTGTIAGAVGAHDTTLPAGVVEIAGIGQTSAPTAVTSGRAVRAWFSLVGAQMVGLLGANGSAIASVTNAVPVGGKDGSGSAQPFLVNASGVAQTSAAKGTSVSSTAAESSHVISASACLVARASMLNGNAATRYLQLHNATSLPSNGAVPVAVIIIGTTQTQVMTFNIPTNKFGTGCVAATSTTGSTLTIGSADALFTVDLFPTNV